MSATAPKVNGRPRVARASTVEPDSGGLMDALLAFAEEAPKLTRNADGQVGGRVYKYANLDGVLDAIVPLLVKHELVWSARPTADVRGAPALRYTLTHVPSGESISDEMPLMGAQDSQGVGSALTYARRYALLAVLNLAPGDDDDGAGASAQNPQSAQAQTAQSAQPTAAAPKPSPRQLSEGQKRLLHARFAEANLDVLTCANIVAVAKGEPARENADESAAKRWLDREIDRLPARLVDSVLEGIAACPPY